MVTEEEEEQRIEMEVNAEKRLKKIEEDIKNLTTATANLLSAQEYTNKAMNTGSETDLNILQFIQTVEARVRIVEKTVDNILLALKKETATINKALEKTDKPKYIG